MHRQVHAPFEQRLFNLLGEHALGADLSQRDVEDLVASGLNDFDFNFTTMPAKLVCYVVGLLERELGPAGPNAKFCHQPRPCFFAVEPAAEPAVCICWAVISESACSSSAALVSFAV